MSAATRSRIRYLALCGALAVGLLLMLPGAALADHGNASGACVDSATAEVGEEPGAVDGSAGDPDTTTTDDPVSSDDPPVYFEEPVCYGGDGTGGRPESEGGRVRVTAAACGGGGVAGAVGGGGSGDSSAPAIDSSPADLETSGWSRTVMEAAAVCPRPLADVGPTGADAVPATRIDTGAGAMAPATMNVPAAAGVATAAAGAALAALAGRARRRR